MTSETNLALLSEYDFIVAIDAFGSMGETDMPGGRSRWAYMQETATAFARDLQSIDADGIDVVRQPPGMATVGLDAPQRPDGDPGGRHAVAPVRAGRRGFPRDRDDGRRWGDSGVVRRCRRGHRV